MSKLIVPENDLGGGLSGGVVNVTPAMAKKWLEQNDPKNRSVSFTKVQSLANDMRNGDWKLTHQGICFNDEGKLVDGQHRLQAVVMSEATIQLLVVGNPEGSVSDPIDRSIQRSLSFLLGKSTRIIAAVNMLRCFETGYFVVSPLTTAEANTMYEHHKGAFEALHTRVSCFSRIIGPALAACAWAFPCNETRVTEFAQQIATGEMIKRGDPAFAFRNWINSDRSKGVTTWSRALAALNACRYYVHNMPLTSIYTGESGYRASTAKRRNLKIPYTPGTDLVTGIVWKPGEHEDREDSSGSPRKERAK